MIRLWSSSSSKWCQGQHSSPRTPLRGDATRQS